MKNHCQSILWTLLAALVLTIPGCRGKDAIEADRAEHGPEAPFSITLKPGVWEAAGIRTEKAVVRLFKRRITAPGALEFNARRLSHLTARTPGRVERLLAVAGDRVGAGQVLADVYSPDYMSMQAEYLQAAERAKRLGADPAEASAAKAILESARARLLLVGATETEIDSLGSTRIVLPLLSVRAPFAGTVIEAGIQAGDHVELGTSLFRLADPSVLWARLHFREEDMAFLEAGADAELRAQAYPGETFSGRLLLVGDVLDEETRTVLGRVEVPNPSGRLKAGMFVEVALERGSGRSGLGVPEAAVQDDEGRQIVFVQAGERTFIRREIKAGERLAGMVEVLDGLEAGETVVTSGSFLLKSEMRKGSLEDEHGHS